MSIKPKILYLHCFDFRITDNPVLEYASGCPEKRSFSIFSVDPSENGFELVSAFIYDDELAKHTGSASKLFLHHILLDLENKYLDLGVNFLIKQGDFLTQVKELIRDTGSKVIAFNKSYEPFLNYRQEYFNKNFPDIEIKEFNSRVITDFNAIKTKSQEAFKVFTPFSKCCLEKLSVKTIDFTNRITLGKTNSNSLKIDNLNLLGKQSSWQKNWQSRLLKHFDFTEESAEKIFNDFLKNKISNYHETRNSLDQDGTSKLSHYLHFGIISPAKVFYLSIKRKLEANQQEGYRVFVNEILWREFAYYILYYFPFVLTQNFNKKFDNFCWDNDPEKLSRWQRGLTGFPIVDAAMHQLWQTGWMHNRARMIVGSFLTKDLHLHWQHGADWFNDTLIDADHASNILGWQWVSGCGVDAAPYFRIFNPDLQAAKFDPQQSYIKCWLPESGAYPKAIIDHKIEKDEAMRRYSELK